MKDSLESRVMMNDSLVNVYFAEFIRKTFDRGVDVQDKLYSKVKYILIVPEDQDDINGLAEYVPSNKPPLKSGIKLSPKLKIDRLILKINLYRELLHVIGVPYDQGSVIMCRNKKYGFSYAIFDNVDVMDDEINKALSILQK
tara:strand:- start:11960 stop:12385 length:426 start_codon:yes stop_codon:yes gene_type:complete